ncbi:myb-binding protein 1A-like protein [Chanos chanos]|uniref:Myb-binding protein 1A-like protein n=1 Tax=Chanos chanos TaxID=29144 RepID=A0A6J2WSU8_CHACN|nr:myb-binding protein 1A [Chanos chanos]
MGEVGKDTDRPKLIDAKGILKQNREFLDFFWDIAKPERETRLRAIENLVAYLKHGEKPDELKYTLKRLVDGLSHTREEARTGFSVALAQVLSAFEEISLRNTLDQIKEKHNLKTASKKLVRNVAFGNFFGVLALSQSARLHKEPQVLLECVQTLQALAQYRDHLRDLPRKTMVDILSETSEEVFEEVLLGALQTELTSAFSTPEQLELLLVAMQKFPSVLKPQKLQKLLGTSTIITADTLPKLVQVMKMAARSVKKEHFLPAVAFDLLQASLREGSFELFWNGAVVKGMLSEQPGPTHYLSFRMLGAALPLLSKSQLSLVLSGEVMKRYGEHTLSAQLPDRYKFSPEMEGYVGSFLQGCPDPEKQLTVMVAFTQLTNQGYPVVPSYWKVVEHLVPTAVQSYVEWLKDHFCQPHLESCLDFSTRRQAGQQDPIPQSENHVLRFRKWVVARLASIIENRQVQKEEELVKNVASFIFFHAFFDANKSSPDIPETECVLSVPLDAATRAATAETFYSLLQYLTHLPVVDDSADPSSLGKRRVFGLTSDGSTWIYSLVQYADLLLNHPKHARPCQAFSPEHRHAWESMLQSVENLQKKAKKSPSPEVSAFEQLFLLVGIQMFKAADESVELLKDLQSCVQKAQEKKSKRKKKVKSASGAEDESEEPHWVEVVVEILLSLLSQPSRLVRRVCKTVFSRVCPHLTHRALTAILDVLDPNKDEDESGVVVTDEKEGDKTKKDEVKEQDESDKDSDDSESSEEEEEEDDKDEAMEKAEEVDQNFRLELMKVLQGQNALATEEDGSDEEELDDEAMMKLDGSIAALFAEQKKKIQAKKDEKDRLRREKVLVRDFKIKVLDLVEVFLSKQGNNPLVLNMLEPLLSVIENGMKAEADQQEQNFLAKAADIFRNQLCRGKMYCRNVEGREAELHDLMERLINRAQTLADSSVSLYYFSAALYVLKVLRGVVHTETEGEKKARDPGERLMGKVDVERVTSCFKDALSCFMTKRKSPLTGTMFIDLFTRFPVLCVNLLDTAVGSITAGVREHQQGQACAMVLRALQARETQQILHGSKWTELCQRTVDQTAKSLEKVELKNKASQETVLKALELCQFLLKTVHQQKLDVDVGSLENALQALNGDGSLQKPGRLSDTYWSIMKHFGVQKPKVEKVKKAPEEQTEQTGPEKKKKKGFLPETKKRKNRKKTAPLENRDAAAPPRKAVATEEGDQGKKKKNRKRKRKERGGGGGGDPEGQSPPKQARTQQTAQTERPQKKRKGQKEKKGMAD